MRDLARVADEPYEQVMAGPSLDVTVRAARDAYLAENGFSVEAYDARWTDASFLGMRFRVPNTKRHRAGIMLHDLHHIITGFGTDLVGEGEISAWEARNGLMALGAYVAGIVMSGALLGLVVAPRRTLHAFRAAGRGRSLFPFARLDELEFAAAYERLLSMTVGDLRRDLGVPKQGVATHARRLHDYAPKTASDPS
jgi:hypothetical protein